LKWIHAIDVDWEEGFPILRGRLLKYSLRRNNLRHRKFPILRGRLLKHGRNKRGSASDTCFQSLEGGY